MRAVSAGEAGRQRLLGFDEAAAALREGRHLFIAGEEEFLRELPAGRWVGGTIPYFAPDGRVPGQPGRAYVWEVPPVASSVATRRYDARSISSVYADAPDNGFSLIVMPAASPTLQSFALGCPGFDEFACRPLIGWVSGVRLPREGRRPRVFDGRRRRALDDGALVMHVTLPRSKTAEVGVVNIFEAGEGDVLSFPADGFGAREVLVNGTPRPFAAYLKETGLDTRFPLVADFGGATVNTSFQEVDEAAGEVRFYAPVFRGVSYRHARPVCDYERVFASELQAALGTEISYSANCVLNYLYAGLEGPRDPALTGPATFGEVAYQLLNQTLVYLRIVEANLADRLRREAVLRKRLRTQETLLEELSAYDYTVSHDLKAPLRHILSFSQMLKATEAAASDARARELAGRIEGSAARMAALLDDLLEFSKAGRVALRCSPVDLGALVQSVRRELDEPGAALVWEVGPLPIVQGDPVLLRQAVANLLANAVKFTRASPRPRVEVVASRAGSQDVLVVRDNGVGFEPERAAELFKPFRRLIAAKEFPGTGLGLAIVARIAARHGGRVWAEGSPGEGASFFLALPRLG